MLVQIVSLILQVLVGLVGGACLLRLYLQHQRIPLAARAGNPLGPLIFALTDWLVLPLRRVLPALGRWDSASLVAAYLLELLQLVVLWLMTGGHGSVSALFLFALLGLLRLALSGASALLVVYALLSWVRGQAPLADLVERMVAPWLRPLRRIVPLVGGIDLSPLLALVLLQIVGIVLDHLVAGPSLF